MALGVDRLSHIACLAEDGKTIAVLAHGLEKVYPASNKKLAEQILLNNFFIISAACNFLTYFIFKDVFQSRLRFSRIVPWGWAKNRAVLLLSKSNRSHKLAEQILLCGGTLLSEYPVGTEPTKFRFVRRNRLIVGLSKVTVAMECEESGGSMSAKQAI